MKQNTEQLKKIEEIAKKVHIEWLEKAETAIINGREMTVLPYGYLSQAVEKVLQEHITKTTPSHDEIKREAVIGFVEWNKTFTFEPENEGYDIQEALAGVHAYFELLDLRMEQYLTQSKEGGE